MNVSRDRKNKKYKKGVNFIWFDLKKVNKGIILFVLVFNVLIIFFTDVETCFDQEGTTHVVCLQEEPIPLQVYN